MIDMIDRVTYAKMAKAMFSLSDKVYYSTYNSDNVRASATSCLMTVVLEMMHNLPDDKAQELIDKVNAELAEDEQNKGVA